MSALFDDENFVRDAEMAAEAWARQHHHTPITEERAAQWLEEGLQRRPARHRANEDGTPARVKPAVCPDADGHAIGYPDVTVWVRHKRATGTCADCGGMVP